MRQIDKNTTAEHHQFPECQDRHLDIDQEISQSCVPLRDQIDAEEGNDDKAKLPESSQGERDGDAGDHVICDILEPLSQGIRECVGQVIP